MTAALETNTEALREILQTVNTLPEAGSVATEQVFIATRETTYSELQQQGPAKACFFSDEEGFIYPLTGYTGEAYVFSGVRDDLKRLGRYVIRNDGKGFVYEYEILPQNVVQCTPQELTEDQKAQARANIGAATVEDVLAALPTWTGGSY